ncbi:hypothetical protein V2H45_15330 [Tumidithrix elongata RA019]|uniref:Uncharacterized protein n=1 Tax=Tumidithrix elongata BACA0141 TaxID=2716417 RepID=A0AAW9Q584_9CYAN|nr:hypothetical protein [Tumidithrix elongata RA019]
MTRQFSDRSFQNDCSIDLKVTVCLLKDGAYNDVVFTGDRAIVSPTFQELGLTVIEVLRAKG